MGDELVFVSNFVDLLVKRRQVVVDPPDVLVDPPDVLVDPPNRIDIGGDLAEVDHRVVLGREAGPVDRVSDLGC